MSDVLLPHLVRHEEHFSVEVKGIANPGDWVIEQLLGSPAMASTISGISYTIFAIGSFYRISFSIAYAIPKGNAFVFLVRDEFELICAMSLVLRKHLNSAKIVIDNRSALVRNDDIFAKMRTVRLSVGEDLELGQATSTRSQTISLCGGNIVVYSIDLTYFESPSTLNALTCVVAEHAQAARNKVGNDSKALVNELLRWFRENVKYRNTDTDADHSAAGLIRNGTAVCQGIAVYAHLFLWSCGIQARYVTGIARKEAHAWNLVKIEGTWRHIDYTFALPGRNRDIFSEKTYHFESCHHWDRDAYSVAQNDRITGIKKKLTGSIISVIPNSNCYSVNGCIVDTSNISPICIIRNNTVYVSASCLFQDIGGGYLYADSGIKVCYGSRIEFVSDSKTLRYCNDCYIRADALPTLGFALDIKGDVLSIRLLVK